MRWHWFTPDTSDSEPRIRSPGPTILGPPIRALFQLSQGPARRGCTFFYPVQDRASGLRSRAIGGGSAALGGLARAARFHAHVSFASWTPRAAAGAAAWVAPTCCSERAPLARDRRIGCMGDLTSRTASQAPRYSLRRFACGDRNGLNSGRWPDAAAFRFVCRGVFTRPFQGPQSAGRLRNSRC